MSKRLTKSQLVAELSEKWGVSKKQAGDMWESMMGLLYSEVKRAGEVVLPGLGKLVLVNRKARMGRNPQTGEPLKIPAKKVVKFRVAKACKDAVLGK